MLYQEGLSYDAVESTLRPYASILTLEAMLDFVMVLEAEADDPIWSDVMLDIACQHEAKLNASKPL